MSRKVTEIKCIAIFIVNKSKKFNRRNNRMQKQMEALSRTTNAFDEYKAMLSP